MPAFWNPLVSESQRGHQARDNRIHRSAKGKGAVRIQLSAHLAVQPYRNYWIVYPPETKTLAGYYGFGPGQTALQCSTGAIAKQSLIFDGEKSGALISSK